MSIRDLAVSAVIGVYDWERETEQLRDAFRRGDTDAMGAAVTDEMVETIAVCGTTDQTREMLRKRVASLPRGLDTELGTGGTTLSAGEEQLVAFAQGNLAFQVENYHVTDGPFLDLHENAPDKVACELNTRLRPDAIEGAAAGGRTP